MTEMEGDLNCDNRWEDVFEEEDFKDEEFRKFLDKTKENLSNLSISRNSTTSSEDDNDDQEISNCFGKLENELSQQSETEICAKASSEVDNTDLEFMNFLGGLKNKLSSLSEDRCSSSSSEKSISSFKSSYSDSASSGGLKNTSNESLNESEEYSIPNLQKIEEGCYGKFAEKRVAVSKKLYKFFNEKIFESKLPEDMVLEWSTYLRTTAGQTSLKRKGDTYSSAKIILSTKVLTAFDRLRDTLLHEMCHAAVALISQVEESHGPLWKSWAARCSIVLPDIVIPTRCHNYDISHPFYYQCSSCKFKIGRQRKSSKLSKALCPHCRSSLHLVKS